MPFGMVSGVGRGMAVLDVGDDRRRGRGRFGSEFGASYCNQWRHALLKLLWRGLVLYSESRYRAAKRYALLMMAVPTGAYRWCSHLANACEAATATASMPFRPLPV